jgi:iron complex outermembrane receptor protein
VVTGSYIKGSPQDAELPIDVITEEDLLQQGSPSMIEMIRNLGVTAANLGETNQFTTGGQANEGVATVNLRGMGVARTLVLLNGRRHVATETLGVDISAFPISAIGRVEVLKDGAAAV